MNLKTSDQLGRFRRARVSEIYRKNEVEEGDR